MKYTNELKNKGFKVSYDRVAATRDGYDLIVDISKNNSYLKCSFSMSHQRVKLIFHTAWGLANRNERIKLNK